MNRTAIVTGASGGIGGATAIELAKNGYNVVLTYNTRPDCAKELFDKLSEYTRADMYRLDLGDESSIRETADKICKLYPTIDLLVNNAGMSERELFTDKSFFDIKKIIDVNLTGTMLFTQEILKKMLRRGVGAIVNVSSIWGKEGASMEVAYSAAKAGIIGFTRALAKEVAPMGVRVNAVAPGAIDTPMLGIEERVGLSESVPLMRLGAPEEVAGAIRFLAEAEYITGEVLSVDGGGIL